MNEDTKTILESVNTAQEIIKNAKEKLKTIYQEEINKLLKPYPDIENLSIHLNNHDFNDGDATYFSLNYDDLTINFKDGTEYSGYPKNQEKEKILQELVDFFRQFDVDDFYEDIYSEEYDEIVIKNS